MKKICERIREGLDLRDMKQTDLVNLTGITKGALSSYISGAYEPKQRNIYKIAQALNVNEAWLMGYDISMEREISTSIKTPQDFSIINYNILQYMRNLGYEVIGDESEGYLSLDTKDAEYEITLSDLKDLENTTESFIKFKISEIINKSRKFNKDKVIELPQKKKEIWEEEGKEHLMPKASHDKDGEFTEEEYKHDDDLMNDDSLWE